MIDIKDIRIVQMVTKNWSPIPNHLIITLPHAQYLQSYDSIVVERTNDGAITLDTNWDYSQSTRRNIRLYLDLDLDQIRDAIKSGTIQLTNLNRE